MEKRADKSTITKHIHSMERASEVRVAQSKAVLRFPPHTCYKVLSALQPWDDAKHAKRGMAIESAVCDILHPAISKYDGRRRRARGENDPGSKGAMDLKILFSSLNFVLHADGLFLINDYL